MKYSKYILEAINRGIKLALDDYEELSANIVSPKRDIIKNPNATKKLIDFYSLFVDLGLPSGTLWRKYNLGVDPNNINNPDDATGNFYAWGETELKMQYEIATYEHCVKASDTLTKYCVNSKDGYVDNLSRLQLNDDAAYIENRLMHIPTKLQCLELIKYTEVDPLIRFGYMGNKDIPYLNIKSKINGAELHFPSTGFYAVSEKADDLFAFAWSSDIYESNNCGAYALRITSSSIECTEATRTIGLPIRPVIDK